MNKQLAEFIGTFALVFFGCGAAAIGGMGTGATAVDLLGIASAFGFAIVAMAYGIGPISGCHVNPAVSFGVFVAGRMSAAEMVTYWIAQVLGRDRRRGRALSHPVRQGLRAGPAGSARTAGARAISANTTSLSAFVFEVVATFLFLVTILGVTHPFTPKGFAGLAIGLTLAAIHLVGINITGTSVNPARSIGPALVGFGLQSASCRAALAVHHRPADRRRPCGHPLSRRRAPRSAQGLSPYDLATCRRGGPKARHAAYQRPHLPPRRAAADRRRDRRAAERARASGSSAATAPARRRSSA